MLWNPPPSVKLQYPSGYVIEEIPAVSKGYYRTGIELKVMFEPSGGFDFKVIRRLAQQQNLGLLEQEQAKGTPPSVTS